MLCGKNKKTDRCMQVYNEKDISSDCEVNNTTSQKRCKRKTIKTTPRPRGRPKKTVPKTIPKEKICPKGKELNPKTGRCNKIKPLKNSVNKSPPKSINEYYNLISLKWNIMLKYVRENRNTNVDDLFDDMEEYYRKKKKEYGFGIFDPKLKDDKFKSKYKLQYCDEVLKYINYMMKKYNIPEKICPKGKELNPKTGRCNKIKPPPKPKGRPRKDKPKTPVKPVKPRESSSDYEEIKYRCEPGKIYNHSTGRCVKKDSVMGKKIMTTSITDTIGGPITMNYYKFEHDGVKRHILFFGDEHTQYKIHNSKNIIQITTLIKKIIRNSPYCIDLFSENPPYENRAKGKALQLYGSPLSAIRNEFGTCPSHNFYGKCKYKNLRYHNWDLRFQRTPGGLYLANPYDEVFMRSGDEYNKIIKKFPKKDIIYYLLGFTEKLSKNKEKEIDRHFDHLFDELYKRDSFDEAVTLPELLNERRKLIRKEYNKCMKSVKFPKDLLETFVDSYDKSNDTDLTLVFTDFYMICRMFMNFDTNKKTPKLCPTKGKNNFKTPRYIIVFAGDAHVQNVIKCLGNLFGEDKFKPEYCTKKIHMNKLIKLNDLYTGDIWRGSHYMKYKDHHNITKVDELFKDFYE